MGDSIGAIVGTVGGALIGGPAGAAIGASLGGGYDASQAAGRASDAMQQASREQLAPQREMWQQGREDTAPWRQAGAQAVGEMQNMLSGNYDLTTDPGYQFRLEQGTNALDASAAARGNLFSGRQLKALTEYGQNFGTNEYNNRFNRLASMAGMGQVSSGQSAGLGANYAQQMGGSIYDAGQARASGYMGQANAWQNALNQGLYAYGMSQQPQMTQWGTIPGSQQSNMLAAQW